MPSGDPAGLRFEDRMGDLEALMWVLEERDPRLRATMAAVALLDGRPDPGPLGARVEALARRVPRLRERVSAGPAWVVAPRWEADPDFDLARHVCTLDAPGQAPLDGLLRAAEEVVAAGFDRRRPLWRIALVTGLAGGRAGLVLALHHALTDGLGALRLAGLLFDAGSLGRVPTASPAVPATPGRSRLWEDLRSEAGRGSRLLLETAPWAARVLRDAVTDPAPLAAAALDQARWLVRGLDRGAPATRSRLAARSASPHFAALAAPLGPMRRAGAAAGGTVNDVFVAALVAGLRRYHAHHGLHPPELAVGIPFSTRTPASASVMRNQVLPLRVRLPLQLADPAERIRIVHAGIRRARRDPSLGLADLAAAAALRLPPLWGPLVAALGSVDVVASNLTGAAPPRRLAGRAVERLVPLGPRGACALNVTALGGARELQVGINADPAAIPDLDVLVACLAEGVGETVSA